MTTYKTSYLWNDIEKKRGKRLIWIEDFVDEIIQGLELYVNQSREEGITAASNRNHNT